MPCLRDISTQAPVVILDAASALVQVGVIDVSGDSRWETSHEESGVAIFQCLERLAIPPGQVAAWIYCEGPGSVLGIRTAAMAIRTWNVLHPRPVFAFNSLALVARALGRQDVGVIADARRDTWHLFTLAQGLRRVPTAELAGELVMPEHFRHWSALPREIPRTPYSLASLLPRVWADDLLRPVAEPDAFLHEEPSYAIWTPRIHGAPAS